MKEMLMIHGQKDGPVSWVDCKETRDEFLKKCIELIEKSECQSRIQWISKWKPVDKDNAD